MGTFGISSEMPDDHRIQGIGAAAIGLWVSSIAWTSRTGGVRPLQPQDLPDLGSDINPADIDKLVTAGLWAGDESIGWSVVENGLWTLSPDTEPDVLGDGPDAFEHGSEN
jgi:hypothetical protein